MCWCRLSLPQDPTFGEYLYREAMRLLGWSHRSNPLLSVPDPRFQIIALLVARELGDDVTAKRLRDSLDETAEPLAFGADGESFGYGFGTGEDHPRGQLSALMMLCETGEPGAWTKVFNNPSYKDRFTEPTVEGVEFPKVGICEARNDPASRALSISTYAATPSAKGEESAFRVTRLPDARNATVLLNGERYPNWRAVSGTEIEIRFPIGQLGFTVLPSDAVRSDARGDSTSSASTARPSRAADVTIRRYPPTAKRCSAGCC